MKYLRERHLWPLYPDGFSIARTEWLVWRWWAWPIMARYARWRCKEHGDFYSTKVGVLRDLLKGGGRQQVRCGQCGVVVWEEP